MNTRPYPPARRHTTDCTACDSLGRTTDIDSDEHGTWTVSVRCEECCGLGVITSCNSCHECIPLPVAEAGNGVCGPCRAAFERGDAQAEVARIGAWRQ
jgi:hypothetical protein